MDLQEHKTVGNKKAKTAYVKRYIYFVALHPKKRKINEEGKNFKITFG